MEAALELDRNERERFVEARCAGEPELLREVRAALAEDARTDAGPEPPGPFLEPERPPERVGAYEVLRAIGRGGMGAVYLAERADRQFEQRVAVKVLKRGLDTSELVARFRRERQVLADLEHPGIARLIDGGETEDGRPYIVMEYVEGVAVDRWCEERRLSTRDRLELFLRICEAVQYAHGKLVVHRDLKPSNVLVTASGDPKLLDFGIAKMLDPSAPSITREQAGGARFMTPEYASPEQVRGEAISTASDVYSLGALLYQLLTGRTPHDLTSRTLSEIERTVCDREPARPSAAASRAVRRELAGDLVSIVMKALRKEARRRYGSVEQLAADVRRHLEGLPVQARPDSAGYRLGKFLRRNRVPVATTGAVVLALAAGFWNSDRLLREAREAWREEARQRGLAETRLDEVRRLSRDLEAQRGLAQERFEDVRGLATKFVFDVHDRLRNLPGTVQVREEIVRTAKDRLDALTRESGDDPSLRLELAQAYVRLGDSQGNPHLASLGQTGPALESYRRALALAAELAREGHPSPDVDGVLVHAHGGLGDVQLARGDFDGAAASYRTLVELTDRRHADHPDDPAAAGERARARHLLADALFARGHHGESLAQYERASELVEGALSEQPGSRALARQLAGTLTTLGVRRLDQQDWSAAEDTLRRALRVIEPFDAAAEPADLRLLASANLGLARLLARVPPVEDEARERMERALGLYAELSSTDPLDLALRRQLAEALLRFGEQLGFDRRHGEALPYLLRSEELMLEVCGVDPENLANARELAATRDRIGKTFYELDRLDESIAYLRQARETWEALLAAEPENPRARRDLAVNSWYLGFATSDRHPAEGPRGPRLEALRESERLVQHALDTLRELEREGLGLDADLANIDHLERVIARVRELTDENAPEE